MYMSLISILPTNTYTSTVVIDGDYTVIGPMMIHAKCLTIGGA